MSEVDDKNRDIRIKQQKSNFMRNVVFCISVVLIFAAIFWVFTKNASGEEISFTQFKTELATGNIKEIEIKQNKIQIYTVDDTPYWMYRSDSEENVIFELIEEMYTGELNGNPYTGTIPKLVRGTTSTVSIISIIFPIIMLGVSIFMVVLIIKHLKGANNKSFEFVKNRARVYPSKTKFSDVAGEDEEKAELEDIVDFLKSPQKYIQIGAKIPKGVLLVGPPGTGKTLLAKAVAGEAGVPFFTISGSDFMELFVGVGASRVRDLFETAKKAKPCIIFIDEIDAVGRQRGAGLGGGNDEREQTLNQLLVQMDGFEDNEGIVVMAATNRVDILDPALLRPGRFDRRVNISIPDVKGREEILKVHSKNKPLDKNIDLKTIARITSGFTGAEIENLLNEAAILVAKENRKEITTKDIQISMMKVTLGPQKRSRVISEEDRYNTAIHESGHAIINKLAKHTSPVQEVSIIPRGGAGGYTMSADDDRMFYYKDKLFCKIQMLLGGIVAEKLFVGDISTGASSDLKRATSIARRMVTEWGMSSELGMVYSGSDDAIFIGKSYQERMPYSENQAMKIDNEVKNIIDFCQKETESILTKNKEKLLTMANILIEKETIYAEEVDLIIKGLTKEEIVEYIENKDKKTEDVVEEPTKTVDELLKIAEEREAENKQKKENEKVDKIDKKIVKKSTTRKKEDKKTEE